MTALKAWLAQPSTILGLGAFAATICGLIAHVLTHDTTAATAAGMAAFALVHIALPDNSAASSSVEKLVTDAVTAAAQKRLAAAIPMLVSDSMAVFAALAPVAPLAAPAPAVPPVPVA